MTNNMQTLKIVFLYILLIQSFTLIVGVDLLIAVATTKAAFGLPFHIDCFVRHVSTVGGELSFENDASDSLGHTKLKHGQLVVDVQPESENYELAYHGTDYNDTAQFRLTIKKPTKAHVMAWWCHLRELNVISNFFNLKEILYISATLTGSHPDAVMGNEFVYTCTVKNAAYLQTYVNFKKDISPSGFDEFLIQKMTSCQQVYKMSYPRYKLSCGAGTRESSSKTKIYTLTIDELIPEDAGQWFCQLNMVAFDPLLSNVLILKFKGCRPFWYGDDCSKRCNCRNITEVCDGKTGLCKSGCPEDKTGPACDIQCHCSGGCPDHIKECNSCEPGFQGPNCQQGCNPLQYGKDCSKQCNCLKAKEVCDVETGFCKSGCPENMTGPACDIQCLCSGGCPDYLEECKLCEPGYQGSYCQQECKPYWYGNGCSKQCSCQDTKEACEVKTGFCKSGCPEDKTGPACDIQCHCLQGCRDHLKECISCEPGYQGPNCQQECKPLSYGKDCSKQCNCQDAKEVCNVETGFCKSGCPENMTGSACDIQCRCSGGCPDHLEECNSCEPGFQGPNCQEECKPHWYGKGCSKQCNCRNITEVCDVKTGFCKSGCPEEKTGPACDIKCHCSGGCPDHLKKCVTCDLGFQGPYCEKDIDECAKKLHTCTAEGQECVNIFGSFRCTCKNGYLLKGRHCVRKSRWGTWMEKKGECKTDCRQTINRYRYCVDPPPAVRGDKCNGNTTDLLTHKCKWGNCVSSLWLEWTMKTDGVCDKSCEKKVIYKRQCFDVMSKQNAVGCPGISEKTLTETCTGDNCDECATAQHNCFEEFGQMCKDTQGSFKCVCKKGFAKVPGKEKCYLKAAWSTWVKVYKSGCSASCSQQVQLRRYCTNPPPLNKIHLCEGGDSQFISEKCTGGNCENHRELNKTKIDRCTARLHTCTNYGQQCENTQQGTIRCTCRQGFTRANDQCLLKGQWGDWEVDYGECKTNCTRMNKKTRFCLTSSEFGVSQLMCSGDYESYESVQCLGGQCRESYWTDWIVTESSECQKSCTHQVKKRRKCIHLTKLNVHSECIGSSVSWSMDSCTDGNCVMDECKKRTNDCYKTEGMECIDKKRSYTCGCRNGYNKVGHKCARNGGWSTWVIYDWGNCDLEECRRIVELRRYCTDPAPDAGGNICFGINKNNIRSKCTYYECGAQAAKSPITEPQSSLYISGSSVAAAVCLAVGLAVYYRSKKKETSKSITEMIWKSSDDIVPYENPSFTLYGKS